MKIYQTLLNTFISLWRHCVSVCSDNLLCTPWLVCTPGFGLSSGGVVSTAGAGLTVTHLWGHCTQNLMKKLLNIRTANGLETNELYITFSWKFSSIWRTFLNLHILKAIFVLPTHQPKKVLVPCNIIVYLHTNKYTNSIKNVHRT